MKCFVNAHNNLDKQRQIERAIKRAKDALNEAITLIKQQQIPKLKNVLYSPENEKLFDYLDKYNHKFNSKRDDFLIINTPNDFDAAVETWKNYDKYTNDETIEHEDPSTHEPIVTYYFNRITSLKSIYEALHSVFMKELKPFKIHFQLSGVFESQEFDFEEYEAKYSYETRWNMRKLLQKRP